MGDLDMGKPASGVMTLLKKLKPKTSRSSSGEGQMRMLRRLPQILRFLPGKAQDLRAYFLTMQYWLGGSDDNVREMIRFLVSRYSLEPRLEQGRGEGAGRLPRGRALPPRPARQRDRDRCGGPARARGSRRRPWAS
jgi:hypothetical protein